MGHPGKPPPKPQSEALGSRSKVNSERNDMHANWITVPNEHEDHCAPLPRDSMVIINKYKLPQSFIDQLPKQKPVKSGYRKSHPHMWQNTLDLSMFEKIRLRMMYNHRAIFGIIGDKIAVQDYAKSVGVGSPKFIWQGKSCRDIPFEDLPKEYVLKMTPCSGCNLVFRNIEGVTTEVSYYKKPFEKKWVIAKCESWMEMIYYKNDAWNHLWEYGYQWAYRRLGNRLVVEPILYAADGVTSPPPDYKCHIFNEKTLVIEVIVERFNEKHIQQFFSRDWERLPIYDPRFSQGNESLARPDNLSEIVDASDKLATDLDYARIDLYATNEGIVLGEITNYPESGVNEWEPKDLVCFLGRYWTFKL